MNPTWRWSKNVALALVKKHTWLNFPELMRRVILHKYLNFVSWKDINSALYISESKKYIRNTTSSRCQDVLWCTRHLNNEEMVERHVLGLAAEEYYPSNTLVFCGVWHENTHRCLSLTQRMVHWSTGGRMKYEVKWSNSHAGIRLYCHSRRDLQVNWQEGMITLDNDSPWRYEI